MKTGSSLNFILGKFLIMISFCIALPADTFSEKDYAKAELPKNAKAQFLTTSLLASDGRIWVGAEGQGVFSYDPGNSVWRKHVAKDGLAEDMVTALAEDGQRRIWVGHNRRGLSVWNGEKWQVYGAFSGALGHHVFDIAVSPTTKEVVVATEMGLSIYTETRSGGQWWHIHSGHGWPQDRLSSLAFLADGRLVAGFANSGLLIGNLRQAIAQWQRFSASDKPADNDKFEGLGLPGNQINDLLVMRDGSLAVATTAGLAISESKGFRFWRGSNHARKLELLEINPRKIKDPGGLRLREDHCSCLSETGDGKLIVGHWEHGYDLIDVKAGKVEASDNPKDADFIRGFLSPCAGPTWLISYRAGVQICKQAIVPGPAPQNSRIFIQYPKMPFEAAPPDRTWLLDFCQRLSQVRSASFSKQVSISALPDDWRTQGTVMGRRGNYIGVFCAMTSIDDLYTHPVNCNELIAGWMGKNHPDPQDSVRRWRHWKHTDQERCLQNNYLGGRTESEWDDHKETCPRELDGPHVMGSFRIRKPGDYIVSAYFINPNGHDGTARWRDYERKPPVIPIPLVERSG